MKKLFTLRNCLVCVAALFALLVFIFSFVTSVKGYNSNGDLTGTYFNAIWGSTRMEVAGISGPIPEAAQPGALALPIVGTFLVLAGGVCAVVVSFVAPKKKVVLVVAAALLVVGAVLVALTPLFFFDNLAAVQAKAMGVDVATAKEAMRKAGGTLKAPLAVVSTILGVLGGAGVCVSAFLKK